MSAVTLKAHFDGSNIVLDDPYELRPDSRIVVTVLQPEAAADANESKADADFAARALERAYGEQEPEYTIDDVEGSL